MAQSLAKIILHVVFSTKNRSKLILDEFKSELHAYLASACNGNGSHAFKVGGTHDHVHIACTLPRAMSVSALLDRIKSNSSKWMKQRSPCTMQFAWQNGYAVFSIGQSQLSALISYIDLQMDHHGKLDFKEEVLELLEKYQIEYNERYLWD